MGSCFSSNSNDQTVEEDSQDIKQGGEVQLRRNLPRWTSETAITQGALDSKRDEFWETAPKYEGKKEIWDALKAAAGAMENGDFGLASVIIETAGIKVPNGSLSETFDEFGHKYQLPLYCLSPPLNLIKENEKNDKNGDDGNDKENGNKVTIRVRISDQNEKTSDFDVYEDDTIAACKQKAAEQFSIIGSQRWFCRGGILSDIMTVKQCKIPDNFVIQIIVQQVTAETKHL